MAKAGTAWRMRGSGHGDPRSVCLSEFGALALRSSGAAILVMKTSQMRESNDASPAGSSDGPSLWTLLFQREMGSRRMIVGEVGTEEAFQVAVPTKNLVRKLAEL